MASTPASSSPLRPTYSPNNPAVRALLIVLITIVMLCSDIVTRILTPIAKKPSASPVLSTGTVTKA